MKRFLDSGKLHIVQKKCSKKKKFMLHIQQPLVWFPAFLKLFQRNLVDVAELIDSNCISYTEDRAKNLIVVD